MFSHDIYNYILLKLGKIFDIFSLKYNFNQLILDPIRVRTFRVVNTEIGIHGNANIATATVPITSTNSLVYSCYWINEYYFFRIRFFSLSTSNTGYLWGRAYL